ncbi:DUF5686 family protein [Flavobacterium sp.]|uniref:DUF5686 family protein n=1 Tax=Flavobacterium sp. TaxID=239 RepID=UPI003BC3FB31
MLKNLVFTFLFVHSLTNSLLAQTKVGGVVLDKKNQPISYANIVFKGSNEGTVSDENGKFYLESSKNYTSISAAFVGFTSKDVSLAKSVNYNMKIFLEGEIELEEVVIFRGKTSKKNNPALVILRKIWERKRKNGLRIFNQYQYEKYEKIEFDLNTIDSAFMKSKVFKGMEFVFNKMDTSKVTGKTYLPIFINESLYDVYGDNKIKKEKSIIKANKNSGLGNGEGVNNFIKDLYNDYNIYNNHLTFFDKSFTSPLSTTGIDVYNYVLRDSAFIDKKWCYNIDFYPRRKNELTFKGDFWVNDTTFAIKTITMAVSKSANINWVKDIYIEQEFDVQSDSVFLLTRDYIMSDFAFSKKEEAKGVYGKRTTLFRNHKFNETKPEKFYKEEVNFVDNSVFKKDDDYWEKHRFEKLNKDEVGVYKLIDTLKTVPKFKQMYNLVTVLGSGYINHDWFDYGPIFSTVGYNAVEGWRLRVGGRTYFGHNDKWRLQGYTAYGFQDNKIKYGLSGKWMMDAKNRIIISGGNRRDVEQIGASLTNSNDVLGRSFASSSLFSFGANGKLTDINYSNLSIEIEPVKNLIFGTSFSYKTLESASPSFSLDYYLDATQDLIKSSVKQSEVGVQVEYTPNKKTSGYGVERSIIDSPYSRIFVNYSQGIKGLFNSDFDYSKVQLYFKKPILIGPLGRTNLTMELGKTFGKVPLGLMDVIPGNQTFFIIQNTFNNLNFYEFVSDRYATFQWEHNFQGRLFSRIPFMKKLNWREIIGARSVYGDISNENKLLNASGILYKTPTNPYWEYSVGVGNIFKVFRIDASFRGNYRDIPGTNNFTIKGQFGFYF